MIFSARYHSLRILIILMLFFIAAQIIFLKIHLSITEPELGAELFFSKAVLPALFHLVLAQILLYIFLIYVLWYATLAVSALFCFSARMQYFFVIGLWLNTVLLILSLNSYFVPHSIFTLIFRHHLFGDALTMHHIKTIMLTTTFLALSIFGLILINMVLDFYRNQYILRNSLMLFAMIVVACFIKGFSGPHKIISVATLAKPNIIIVGFDAIRTDHLSFFNKNAYRTLHFDRFLRSATVFTEAYTPVASTFPAWASILTSLYPVHNHIRENNIVVDAQQLATLPKILQESGYETIYATDDRRHNKINKAFGFDAIVGPQGLVTDYLIPAINDLPLSNLITPTPIGEFLFPYNYGNRASAATFDPDNFLEQIDDKLQGATHRPVFLAVHFTLSGWPFYWYNDTLDYRATAHEDYENAISGSDELLAKFLSLLKKRGLLDHAIVVLLSDHGITMALRNDRVIKESNFQGDKINLKVKRSRYASAAKIDLKDAVLANGAETLSKIKHNGVDTSTGYGSDLLSLKQNHILFAIKSYGLNIGRPHTVSGRILTLDIAPTLLELLRLPAFKKSDGISLRTYLFHQHTKISNDRVLFFESAASDSEITENDFSNYFLIHPNSGLVTLNPKVIDTVVQNKQRAIIQGDWLLVYYPVAEQLNNGRVCYSLSCDCFIRKGVHLRQDAHYLLLKKLFPAYWVLVNLKTGKWTTETNHPFAITSPLFALQSALKHFYKDEMLFYEL